MDISEQKAIIEAILFAAGKEVEIEKFMSVLELSRKEIELILGQMRLEYQEKNHGIEIIKVNNCYQMATKKELFDYIYPLFDNRAKPNLSSAAMETLSIIAYNPKITRAQIEAIRGVSSDGTVYKLLEFGLIEEAGRLDAPGRPTTYKVTNEFMKMFGISSLDELPELPRYKLDENEQIVIDEVLEAPMPEREEDGKNKVESNNEINIENNNEVNKENDNKSSKETQNND